MIITSLSGSGICDGNGYYHDITIEATVSDAEYIELYRKVRCNKEVSVVNKRHNDAVDALCCCAQAVKSHKDILLSRRLFSTILQQSFYGQTVQKTVVKVQGDDVYNREQGLALCIAKKALGNKSNFNNEFKRWVE